MISTTGSFARKCVVSGMRPTGKLHLGHLVGALQNWVALQEQYDSFYFVADWHALTSDYTDTSGLTSYAYDNVIDWIAAGLDPERSTFFVQSMVPDTVAPNGPHNLANRAAAARGACTTDRPPGGGTRLLWAAPLQ